MRGIRESWKRDEQRLHSFLLRLPRAAYTFLIQFFFYSMFMAGYLAVRFPTERLFYIVDVVILSAFGIWTSPTVRSIPSMSLPDERHLNGRVFWSGSAS